jgi:pyruvate/2-oxoglutarate dehydrogenase complex dihydrolipoamide acyltransferase (E2) component
MLVEPDISPLAKRLAEENNVNWRGLLGSGAGGKIVERDVLEYLAKVMAGEEDINPTAEPLPEGMDAWPEDDVRSFYGGAMPSESAQTQSTADEELFIDTPSMDASVAGVAHQTADDSAAIGEDIFLIDEEVPAAHASLDVSDMSAEPAFVSEVEPFGEVASESLTTDDIAMMDDNLSLDDIATFDDGDSEVFAAMTDGTQESFVADNDVEDLASLFVDGSDSVEDTYAAVSESAVVDQTVSFEAPAEPEFAIPAYSDIASEDVAEALATDSVEDVIASFEDDGAFEAVESLEPVEFETPVAQTPAVEEVVFETPATHVEEVPAQPAPTFTTIAPAVAAVAGAGIAASLAPVAEAPVVTPVAPPVAPSVVPSNLPLVSYGVLLRRHVDLTSLMHAQRAIAEEMGQEEASIASLLLRAAAKAQQKTALVPGKSVGLAVIRNDGVSVAHVHDAATAPFRTVMSQAQQAISAHHSDQIDLAVADMSNFDIDEAVLNIGVPVLTLGRTMYDSSKGTHHSTLSLSGNVSIESGTKFLSAVAELFDSPVRLVI